MINLLAVGPRGSIYQRFNFDGWDAPDAAVEFGPELAARPEWLDHPEWFRAAPDGGPLPRALSAELMTRWRVPAEHHAPLLACRTGNELLYAPTPPMISVTPVC